MELFEFTSVGEKNIVRDYDNQDAKCAKQYKNYRVMAIADGAGSCEHSGIAAKVACESAVDYWINNIQFIKKAKEDLIAENTITVIKYFLKETAKINNHDYSDYCCTLVMCLINEMTGELITFHIGDGSIYGIDNNKLDIISYPENGIFSYQTYFVNQKDSIDHCRIAKTRSDRGIVICSDGLDSIFESKSSVKDGFINSLKNMAIFDKMTKVDDTTFYALT